MSESEPIEAYIRRLKRMGFTVRQAERIADGREVDALPEKEVLQFAHAWEHDRVEPMKPLVEKYGWEKLTERLAKSICTDKKR
jgi:hypothetical protein